MFSTKREKLERKIKSLNALMAEYRTELEEAERRLHKREINKDEAERTKVRTKAKIDAISEKIRAVRSDLETLK